MSVRPQVDARDSAPKLVKSSIADASRADVPRAVEPQIAFEHLHKGLVEYQTRYIENGLRAAGLALLMIGWILTSESARSFVKSSTVARWAAVAGVALAMRLPSTSGTYDSRDTTFGSRISHSKLSPN